MNLWHCFKSSAQFFGFLFH